MLRLCFVCLGNICRSPTAEAVMVKLLEGAGLSELQVCVESAGTAGYHEGEPPDRRSAAAALRRGVRLRGTARQFEEADFGRFDYVLAVDESTRATLASRAPRTAAGKLHLLRSFDAASPGGADVPDPYYGGEGGFENVLDLCEAACAGLLKHLRNAHGEQLD